MNDPQFQYAIIAFFSAWLALVAGMIVLMWRLGRSLDDRHTRKWEGRE